MRAIEVRDWLVGVGIIMPNPQRDRRRQPSEFVAGDRAAAAAPDFATDPSAWNTLNTGVDITANRAVHHPSENYEPPTCPSCGAQIEEGFHHALIEPWLGGEEPRVRCEACGAEALVGDWTGRWTFQVGELAVRFNNWPPLTTTFMDQLGRRLGDRWRVVLEHY